jgi:hypothetical protein
MREKMVLVLGLVVLVLAIATMAIYIMIPGTVGYGSILMVELAAILIAFSAYVVWDRGRSISRGEPVADERLGNVNYNAGYYGFMAAMLTTVGAPLASGVLFNREIAGHEITAAIVMVSGLAFALSYLYLARKGK